MLDLRYLILELTTRCNLHCRYCYHGDRSYSADMSPEVIVQAIRLAAEDGHPFHLQLTGGEPTLVPMLIRKAAEVAEISGRCQSMGIQTNGTLLSPDIIGILKKHAFQVGVSLDGPPMIHAYQRGRAGDTLRGLQQLENAGIPFGTTTVVTHANAADLAAVALILSGFRQARGIGLDLLVNKGRANGTTGINAASPEELILGVKKLGKMVDAVNARRLRPLQWRERELLRTDSRRYESAFCQAGRAQCIAVATDGRIFPCGQTLEDSRFAVGTVWEPKPEGLDVLPRVRVRTAMCADCQVQPICPGDCPQPPVLQPKQQSSSDLPHLQDLAFYDDGFGSTCIVRRRQ